MSANSTNPILPPDQARTRAQLLEAAAEIFATHGFHTATVRDICLRAGANIAAVHYHFGDKEGLYTEVLHHAYRHAFEKYPPNLGVTDGAPAEERLAAFVRSFLLRIFAKGPVAWHGRLMAREMIEPTAALDALVREQIRPTAQELSGIVRELLGLGADEELVRLSGMSVVSQCLFYHHCRPVISRLFPKQKYDEADIDELAAHITKFSLASLQQLATKSKPTPAKKPVRRISSSRR